MTNAERQKEWREKQRDKGVKRWQIMITDKEKAQLECVLKELRKNS